MKYSNSRTFGGIRANPGCCIFVDGVGFAGWLCVAFVALLNVDTWLGHISIARLTTGTFSSHRCLQYFSRNISLEVIAVKSSLRAGESVKRSQ